MRTVSTFSPAAISRWKRLIQILSRPNTSSRTLAQVRSEPFSELWFTAASPTRLGARTPAEEILRSNEGNGTPGGDHKPPDERTVKLGQSKRFRILKTSLTCPALRTLSPLLPNILTTQLPPEILSPTISLHLFPSTHPHLPVVRGKIPYKAALWTAPVAWGCVPVVGNVKLEIISEKIVRSGFITAPSHLEESNNLGEEKLVVRWKTQSKGNGTNPASTSSAIENGGINRGLSTLLGGDRPLFGKDAGSGTFTGLFIFSFDSKGRIANHTIEHADEAGSFDKTSRMVTLTDWLLGKAKWKGLSDEVPVPGLAYKMRICRAEAEKPDRWRSVRP